jgi:hypothetical protein
MKFKFTTSTYEDLLYGAPEATQKTYASTVEKIYKAANEAVAKALTKLLSSYYKKNGLPVRDDCEKRFLEIVNKYEMNLLQNDLYEAFSETAKNEYSDDVYEKLFFAFVPRTKEWDEFVSKEYGGAEDLKKLRPGEYE